MSKMRERGIVRKRGTMSKFMILKGLLVLIFVPSVLLAATVEKLGEDLVNPGHHEQPAWFKNSFLDLREDIADAKQDGKRVLLYFYQDGCPYCAKLLDVNFTQKDIVDKTRQKFDVISLNMWGDREVIDHKGKTVKEKDFAASLRVMFTPTLIFLNEQGEVALRINGYYKPHRFMAALDYVSQKKEKKISFKNYFKEVAPAEAHGKLHHKPYFMNPPYDFLKTRKKGKILMVLFEQKQCPACDELHDDILKRKESDELIQKMDVAQIDIWSNEKVFTPKGKPTTAKHWANSLDIKYTPSAVFFDDKGNEVFRWEAYLKSFHIQSSMDYVASGAYKNEPSFQRYIEVRADKIREQGVEIELLK